MGKGTTASGNPPGAPRATSPDEARRTNAGPRGTPERHAAGQNHCTLTGAKRRRPPGAANPGSAHNTQQTTAQEQVPGNTKPTHPRRTPQPGVTGYKRSAHTNTHTPQHPSQEWRGAAETRAQAHPPTPHTPARSGGVQAECAHEHTHTPAPQPGVAGRSRRRSPSTHTHTAQSSQEWLGTSGAGTHTHTHANTPAKSGGAQPKPKPKHTHPRRTTQPGVAEYKRSGHTDAHTPQQPSQEWRGAAETRAQAHTTTPHTPARSGGVHAERANEHTHTPTPQPGVAGRSRNPSPNTHTHTTHPSQEWRGTSGAGTRKHTHPNTPARSGGAQPKPEPEHTHTHHTPEPGVAGYKHSGHTKTHTPKHPRQEWRGATKTRAQTHTHAAHPSHEWQGTSRARTRTHTHPNTPASSGWAQPKPEPKHTHPHHTPQRGVAGYKRSGRTSTHTPQHPSQEWRGAAKT